MTPCSNTTDTESAARILKTAAIGNCKLTVSAVRALNIADRIVRKWRSRSGLMRKASETAVGHWSDSCSAKEASPE